MQSFQSFLLLVGVALLAAGAVSTAGLSAGSPWAILFAAMLGVLAVSVAAVAFAALVPDKPATPKP